MCTVLLPPGDNPIAANKYIISYQVHYGVRNSLQPVPIPNQLNPVHNLPSYLFKIQFNIIFNLSLCLLPSDCATKTLKFSLR